MDKATPPGADTPIAHGYTATNLNALAVHSARECNWVDGMDMDHRIATAWSAIAEHLLTAYSRPEETDLIAAGWKAVKSQRHRDLQAHGYGGRDRSLVNRAFCRYWTTIAAPAGSPEDTVVDRIALAQIWAELTPGRRDALHAMAEHGSRRAAARSLGLSASAFDSALTRARHAFLALWHEHEKPSQLWGADRPGARHAGATTLVRRRRAKALKRDRDSVRDASRPHKPVGRPRRDLGVPDSELLARHLAGAPVTALAREFGVSRDAIKLRLDSARSGTPTPARRAAA